MAFCLQFDAPSSVQKPLYPECVRPPFVIVKVRIEVDYDLFRLWQEASQYYLFGRCGVWGSQEQFRDLFITAHPVNPSAGDLATFLQPYIVSGRNADNVARSEARKVAEAEAEIKAREQIKPWRRGGVAPGK